MDEENSEADSTGSRLAALRSALRDWLWQAKRFSQEKVSFSRTSLFSGALFFSFGLSGALPSMPPMNPGVPESAQVAADLGKEKAENAEKARTTREECYWQEDVRIFAELGKSGKARVTPVPCQADELNQPDQIGEKKSETPELLVSATSSLDADRSEGSEKALAETIREMTAGYPVEAMASAIAGYDRSVAGLIVGIAKKESNWGKRVPLDAEGRDCFNYWGYKGAGTRGVAMGHGCFGSPEEAVTAIGDRLTTLVELKKTSQPKNLIIWKCGSSCAGHSEESVEKWIADVSLYYDRIVN